MRRNRKFARTTFSENPSTLVQSLSLVDVFSHFMNYKRAQGLSARTLDEHEYYFRRFLQFLKGDVSTDAITPETIRGYVSWMLNERGLKAVTVNVRIRTLKTLLRFCYEEGFIEAPIHSKIALLKTPEDTIQSFTPSELQLLLRQIDTGNHVGFRDFTMVCTLLDTMVRISELLSIRRNNVYLKEGEIRLEALETKTRRSRTVPLSTKTVKLLGDYIKETEDFGEEILFLTYDGRAMNQHSWRDRLSDYGEQAGIRHKRVSPHTFRHTAALLYILNGGDPFSLQKILGHSDMSMVRKYIQMTNADVKRQHNMFSPLKNLRI